MLYLVFGKEAAMPIERRDRGIEASIDSSAANYIKDASKTAAAADGIAFS